MSDVPRPREGRGHRRRHRRQLPGRAPRPARLDRHGPDRQGATPEPGRLDRARVELHLPDRSQQGDGVPHAGESAPVRRPRAQQHLRRHRSGAEARADGGVQPPHDVGQGMGHRLASADACRDQGARAVRERGDPPRRLLHAERLVRRLVADRHADAGRGDRQPPACRCSPTPRCSTSRPRTAPWQGGRRTDKGRIEAEHVVDRLRRVESAHREDGRRHHPAHPGRPPDGRRRADRHPAAVGQGGRLPDHPRHGHVLLRAPDCRLDGGRLVRAPADLHAPRRHPVDPGVGAVAHRAARSRRTTSTSSSRRPSS